LRGGCSAPHPWASLKRCLLGLLVFAYASLLSGSARAHAVGLSRGEYALSGRDVLALYVFSGAELGAALPSIDTDHDRALSPAELRAARGSIERGIVAATVVKADGASCPPRLESVESGLGDAVQVRAAFSCDLPPRVLTIDCLFLGALPAGHRHLATVRMGALERSFIVVSANEHVELDSGTEARSRPAFGAMVWTGVRHIWTGYDHLAFLLGLLLLGGSVRALVGVVSAFTVAHSITLALAVLHVVSVRPGIVEPAIALSIAYVGIENLWAVDPSRRWRITFPFGLLHGFGFASALMELDLPTGRVWPALVAFNLGVELGQLTVLALVLPGILWARRSAWFRTSGVRGLSVALSVAGCVWFVIRVLPR
jgi:hydrogenase/urease accessory protein HupE